ncbi:MAG TPA: DUF349 domain-containing protein [Muribaculum sp.]|jgi:hypothetical protein|uniref:DUF349 domain-containing protein n=1 Tax=Heminiphilus faecis TaxID=2601703 RepID=UPI000EF5A0A1|nr:DUF349 domain-containing protein [Heminiphilus faecis]RLT75714.1 DUF349 domain-containing protein [bacterium J10(2018)]HRF69308.1 DUF349 domain-containing protein [Muribaculum sp.]
MELREQSQPVDNTDQDLTLNEGAPEASAEVEESITVESVDTEDAEAVEEADKQLTKEEILSTLEAIGSREGSEIVREEVTRLKQYFYAIRKTELAAEKQAFLERGNEEAAFAPLHNADEERMHQLLDVIKAKKAGYLAEIEAQQKANLEKKLAIIDELGKMAEDTDNVNRLFPRFRELSQEFKDTGDVPPTDTTDLYRNYSAAVERFYDQLKINKDLRDYDFKKNLEQKNLLLSEAEKLAEEPDVILAFRRLQELHDKWRETGPVAKEIREEIWNKFKDASATVNKRYQAFFEERKARERENEEKKTAICEHIEALDFDNLKNVSGWDQMTKQILSAQEEWKKLGFASKKVNNTLFARFRETCDRFFAKKAEYFKNMRDTHAANLAKKEALCEKAESLKESSDWKKTADQLVALQKEWKTVGPVDKKHSDNVWQRFQEACDYFFDRRKKATSGVRKTEQANLKQKNEIIEKLKAITDDTDRTEAVALVRSLIAEWQNTGHVPFKDKDKVYDAYKAVLDSLYDRFDIKETKANMSNFAQSINDIGNDENRLYRERERLVRTFEAKRNELKTYENNMGFFNVKSKDGNSLLRDMERKIQRIKDDLATLEEKIKLIDSKL